MDKKAQQEALQNAKFAPFEAFISELLSFDIYPSLLQDQKDQLQVNGKKIWANINNVKTAVIEDRPILHDLSSKDRENILSLSSRNSLNVKALIDEKSRLVKLIDSENQKLENAPDPVDTTVDDNKLREVQGKLGEYHHKKRQMVARVRKNRDLIDNTRNLAKRLRDSQEENSALAKEYDYIRKVKKAAGEFVDEITELKANQIRYEFKNILDKLVRKDQDFDEVEFDQNEFLIRIYNDKGTEIQLNERSAGEKQIIALSFIWALTKTAGLSLPFVIDTPLGRLDSIHRNHIIKHYFNALSDQVIILSTDTEVSRDYIDFVQNFMIRGYQLVYDQETKSTKILDGYFPFE
jgi:DNA sulfur modification protein DndD